MKFKAAILQEINNPLVVDELELTPLKVGQVLIKNISSGLCGAQINEIHGFKFPKLVPRTLGHEAVGIVYEVGEGVKKVKAGDKVCLHWRQSKGIEADFPTYIYKGNLIIVGPITTFSEYSIVSENRITKVSDEANNDLVTLMGCALSTALSTINKVAKIQFGESILVVGCEGGVGLNLVAAAKLAGSDVYGIDTNQETRAIQLGAKMLYLHPSKKFDVIISTVGNPKVVSQYFDLLNVSGRFILVGQPQPEQDIILPKAIKMFGGNGQQFIVSEGGNFNPDYDLNRYLTLESVINLNSIIGGRFSLDTINDAVLALTNGRAGRILIDL